MRILVIICLILYILPIRGDAQERTIRLVVPEVLEATGFPRYFLPRFSLKTAIRIEWVGENDWPDLVLNADENGAAVFQGPNALWHLQIVKDTSEVQRFVAWLGSDVGTRTIIGFQPDGVALFVLPPAEDPEVIVKEKNLVRVSDVGELQALVKEIVGAKAVVQADRKRVVRIPVLDSAVVDCLNTPDAYRELVRRSDQQHQ